jgi:hypothetical protein
MTDMFKDSIHKSKKKSVLDPKTVEEAMLINT